MRVIDGKTGERPTFCSMALFALLAVLLLGLSGCGKDRDSWNRIEESGVLRVGVDPTFPPFALDEGSTLRGIDVDLARAVAVELGLEAQFTYFGYDGLYDALTTGQVDALISALVIAPERTREIAYSTPYFDAGLVLVTGEDEASSGMADLRGKTLAVELGALGHVEALEWERALGDLVVVTYGSASDALAAVAANEAQAALVDHVSGRLFLGQQTETERPLAIVPGVVAPEPYAIAVRIDDRILMEKINQALGQLKSSGRLEQIVSDHLGQ